MFFLRKYARRIIPKNFRTWLGKRFDDFLIWHWKFRWWQKRQFKSLDPPKKNGVLLIGYPRGEFGIGSLLRLPALALEEAGIPFKVFDFNPNSQASQKDQRLDKWLTHIPEYNINIFCIGADQLPLLKKILGKGFFHDRHNILYGAWELSRMPKRWLPFLNDMKEIWAMSSFMGKMFRRSTSLPVYDLPLPICTNHKESYSRNYFQIPDNDFVFLFMFDFDSHVARKNPDAVIKAFEYAFTKSYENSVVLVIKSTNGDRHPKEHKTLKNLIDGAPRIIHIQKVLPHYENAALIQCCDCYVSLHRSEGFGLTIAEAMLMGKPVITTGYSGNMDFTTDETSLLVDYKLIPVQQGDYHYSKDEKWAEPDIEQAGDYMKKLVSDRDFSCSFAKKGQELIRNSFSIKSLSEIYKNRLEMISQENSIVQKNK